MKELLFFLTTVFLTTALIGQTKVVKGTLTVFNQYPAANLEVTAKKAKSKVITDEKGKFELVCNEKDNIIINAKVFQSVNRRIGRNEDDISVNLIYKDTPKNRQIATSMGYISQEDLDYALKNLQYENNDYCNYPDVWALIKAKFPGVQIHPTSTGEMGAYLTRGNRTIHGDNNAIYNLDGIRVNDISTVHPCDIAELSLVQSGTAAKYGNGAANGVVVVKTKKAR